MLVIAQTIDIAEEVGDLLKQPDFAGGTYADSVLVVHSDAKHKEEALEALDKVEEAESPVRVIVSVGMLKEGWDVKNVYVICSLRSSVSEILTEQTLGRGLRLPFGKYTDWELLDTLEVIAHERYEQLLKKAKVINEEFIDHRTRAVTMKDAQGNEVTTIETVPVGVEVGEEETGDPTKGGLEAVIGSVEEREKQAEAEADAVTIELKPNKGSPEIIVPRLKMTPVESKFSLNDITDLEPFEKLGKKIAVDPSEELRRIKLAAHIITGPDGFKRTQLAPGKAIDEVEAPASLMPLEDAQKELTDLLLASPVVPQRKGERKAAGRLVNAFIEGLGDKVETILGGYMDRAGTGVIELVNSEHPRFTSKPSFEEVVELIPLAPTRSGRPETSTDRIGAFKKSVGYTGWTKSMYEQVWFDSSTERDLANLIDDEDEIVSWMRLHTGDLPILWSSAGAFYNPDFIAIDKEGIHYVIEVKADKDMESPDVKGKREAAQRWANHVSSDDQVKVEWRYLLVSESDIKQAKGSWAALKAAGGV
jgi:type III restriction enzyme